MAFADQATLANDSAFINKCRAALIFRANEVLASPQSFTRSQIEQAYEILDNSGSDAARMAWLVAAGNSTIAAAAPTVPSDGDTQFAVNSFLPLLG